MRPHPEQEDASPECGASAGLESPGRRQSPARRAFSPRDSAVAPVHWLQGETTLRAYRAQCDHCLQLYDRGRAEGLYGRGEG